MSHRVLGILVTVIMLCLSSSAEARPRFRPGPRGPGFHRGPPPPGVWKPPTCTGEAGSCGFIGDLDAAIRTQESAATPTTEPSTTGSDTSGATETRGGEETTEAEPATKELSSPPSEAPYFYQYANRLHPGSSCQNTSVAMLLGYYGVDITPDRITSRFGKSKAQAPEGLAEVFNTLASEAGIPQRLRAHRDRGMEDLNAQLAAGVPTIVHGYFTSYGHVVLATGYDNNNYTVNDPAGHWNGSFQGGYGGSQSSTSGDGVQYSASSFYSAVSTSNGSSYLAPWWHEVYTTNGAN